MRKIIFSVILLLGSYFQSFGQMHEFIFYTRTGDIQVFVNDEYKGEFGNRTKYVQGVEFDEKNPTISLKLHKEGYEDKEFIYNKKPQGKSTKIFWSMQKKRFRLKEKNEFTFDLSRVKFDIPSNAQISNIRGLTAYWSSIGIKESDVERYKQGVHSELLITGFTGLIGQNQEENLFADNTNSETTANADISIGAIVKDIKIGGKLNPYNPSGIYDLLVKLEIEWQFYDNNSEHLLHKITTSEESFMVKETGVLSEGINLAFSENFAQTLRSEEVIKAINSAESSADKSYKEDVLKQYTITKAEIVNYDSFGKMIKSINPAVVTIKGDKKHGSGFIFSKDGYLLTNYHVVKNNNDLKAIFQMGFELPVEVLNYSEEYDLALLKVSGSGFKSLALLKGQVEVGDEVVAIGTPNSTDLSNTVTKGIVSGKRVNDSGSEFIQTDVSVSPGNSGGPLINSKGLVVGIISQKLIGVGTDGIAFAIPINFALKKLNINLK